MDDKTFAELFKQACERTIEGLELGPMLPFAEEDVLDELFLARLKNGPVILPFLPFVSDTCMHRLAEAYCGGDANIDVDQFYPFMNETDSRMIFHHAIDEKQEPEAVK